MATNDKYFLKTFKKFIGMTPGKYRKEVGQTNALHAQDVMYDISDILPPLKEVGASCSMTLMDQA